MSRRRVVFVVHVGVGLISLAALQVTAQAADRPGRWTVFPRELVSGTQTRIELRYFSERALPPGAQHRVLIEPLSVKAILHCQPSDTAEIVTLDGPLPEVELEPSPVQGVGYWPVDLNFPAGLAAGDSFALVLGNRQDSGEIVGLVNPTPVQSLSFETYTLLPQEKKGPRRLDWQREGWADGLPKVDIVAAPAAQVRLFAPSLVQAKEAFTLRLSVVDAFDSLSRPVFVGQLQLDADAGVAGMPPTVKLRAADQGVTRVKGLRIAKPGVYRIRANLPNHTETFESNPIVVRDRVAAPLYWGNIHNHSWYSECWGGDVNETYRHSRDAAGMDFVAISDHRGVIPKQGGGVSRLLRWRFGKWPDALESWRDTVDAANRHYSAEFVTLVGYEWSSMDTGHYNIYFTDDRLTSLSRYFTPRYVDYGFAMRDLLQHTDALFIPHIHADLFPYFCLDDQARGTLGQLTPAVEVYSDWGDAFFPYGDFDQHSRFGGLRNPNAPSYLWAIEQGLHIAAIGDSDTHTGLPGRRLAGGIAPHHDHPQGLTAVRTRDFTRAGIMQAYRDFRVYGTTGERIFLDVRAGDAEMGQTLTTDEAFEITVEVAGTAAIQRMMLYRGLERLAERSLGTQREGHVVFTGLQPTNESRPYVVAVVQADGNRVYGTPIWVRRASVPDLAWERDTEGALYLVNRGVGVAHDIEVVLAADEHPFAATELQGTVPTHYDDVGVIWTRRRDDQQILFHYRWHGAPIDVQLQLAGAASYKVEANRDLTFSGGFHDDGAGNIILGTGVPLVPEKPQGLSLWVRPRADQPCTVRVSYPEVVPTHVGKDLKERQTLKVALNGRSTGASLQVKRIDALEPGAKWLSPATTSAGFFAADPMNRITEIDEGNNLYAAP